MTQEQFRKLKAFCAKENIMLAISDRENDGTFSPLELIVYNSVQKKMEPNSSIITDETVDSWNHLSLRHIEY